MNNKPPQRSIALIAKMGFQSGLCFKISRRTFESGYLFLNSLSEIKLTEDSMHHSVLALMQNLARSYLFEHLDSSTIYYDLAFYLKEDYLGEQFSEHFLTFSMDRHFRLLKRRQKPNIKITREFDTPYLVSHGNVAQIICRVLGTFRRLPDDIQLRVEERSNSLAFIIPLKNAGFLDSNRFFYTIQSDARSLGMAINVLPHSIVMGTLSDPSFCSELYSV